MLAILTYILNIHWWRKCMRFNKVM